MRLFDLRSLPTRVLGVSAVALLGLSVRVYSGGDDSPGRSAAGPEPAACPLADTPDPTCLAAEPAVPACCQGGPQDRASLLAAAVCEVGADAEDAPTFTADVAPLLQKHCQECHRAQQIGPFPLVTYEQAKRHAFDLATVTADRRMPPWLATPDYGDVAFRHDRSLPDEAIATFQAWADAGCPEGDPADLPPAPEFSEGWALGEPDLIVELPEPFQVPADGPDLYRCFVVPNPLPEDAEVIGLEYKPGNPRVVHHVLGYIDVSGRARQLDAEQDGQGYTCYGGPMIDIRGDLGGWAPGANADFLPEGVGRILPKGADLVIQVHYHPSGKPEEDVTRLGLYFAPKDRPIRKALHWWAAAKEQFVLPADRVSELKGDTLPLPVDVDVYAVAPHMHQIGRDMEMYAETPDGRRIDLIRIDHWDFNWQLQYALAEPVRLPAGSVVKVVAHYDNTADNPLAPRGEDGKPMEVHYGEATTDEMCYGFFAATKADQDLTRGDTDDLHILFRKQLKEFQEKMREEHERRAAAAR